MITNLHPAGVTLNRSEMDARESVARTNFTELLTALYATSGVASGLNLAVSGATVVVSDGLGVVELDGSLRLVRVPSMQTLAVPSDDGLYDVWLNADAWVRLEPYVVGGVTQFKREGALAYAPDGLPADQGEIVNPGVTIGPQAIATLSVGNLLLGTVNRQGSAVTVEAFTPTPAALRNTLADETGNLALIGLDDLDAALRTVLDSMLLKDGTRPMTGGLDMSGEPILNVGAISAPSGDIDASVMRLGGKTKAELLTEFLAEVPSGGSGGSTPAVQYLYGVTHTQILGGGTFMAPRNVTAQLPDVLNPLKAYATFFSGEGELLSRAARVLTFIPAVRLGAPIIAPWQAGTGTVVLGSVRGVSGTNGAYYGSTVIRVSPTEVKHALQKVIPGDSPQVTTFDNVTLAVTATDLTPAPYALAVSGGTLMWGTRNTGVSVAANGDPAQPDVAVLSDWVRGFLLTDSSNEGVTIRRGTQAVNGSVLLAETTNLPVLTVG